MAADVDEPERSLRVLAEFRESLDSLYGVVARDLTCLLVRDNLEL